MTDRILILGAAPDAPATLLELDGSGRAAGRTLLPPDAPARAPQPGGRTALVVPGEAVRIECLILDAHSEAQALAAARTLLAGRLAQPAALHVALDDGADAPARTVAAVAPELMRSWLARAAALGLAPDIAVPAPLLLPPGEDDVVQVLDAGDRVLARGAGLAFSAEPALARRVLAGRPQHGLDGSLEELAARALQPAVNLLQGDFAPASARARPAGRRRLAWLAAALVASPLLLLGAESLRWWLAARALESRAIALVDAALPASAAQGADLATRLQVANEPRAFADATGALFAAVAARPGTHLVELEYQRGDRVRAILFHAAADDIEALHGRLAADGWRLVEGGGSEVPGGLHTGLALEPGA